MATITEIPNETVLKETSHTSETIQTPNGGTIFSSSTTTSIETTATTSSSSTPGTTTTAATVIAATTTEKSEKSTNNATTEIANNKTDENGNANTTTTTTKSTSTATATTASTTTTATAKATSATSNGKTNGIGSVEDLKIVGHLKSIEQINEKRRVFLSNTISEYSTSSAEISKVETKRVDNNSSSSSNGNNNNNSNTNSNDRTDNNNKSEVDGKAQTEKTKSVTESEQADKDIFNNNNNNSSSGSSSSSSNNSDSKPYSNGKKIARIATPDDFDLTPTTLQYATLPLLKTPTSPTSPPPKPPMLSRTRSLNRGPSLTSPPQTPVNKVAADANGIIGPISIATAVGTTTTTSTTPVSSPTTPTPTSTVKITSSIVAEPLLVETIDVKEAAKKAKPKLETELAEVAGVKSVKSLPEEDEEKNERKKDQQKEVEVEDASILRKPWQPVSVTAVVLPVPPTAPAQPAADKPIATSHYERLIEELKCPGCASPMKAPVLLCRTGHSSCEQCTRVLMLCPLCREPYTDMRSLTVEALCSKAHFRCANAAGGCTVRLHLDLLGWHEKQCIFKPMNCFMGRVWGDCQWSGREAYWKDHLMAEHSNKVFNTHNVDLIWNMGVKQKPLTGYYVFEVYDEMFNFYEIYDKERVLFTMTVTSTVKEKKYNFAYEVTMFDRDSDALAITQKFPVHSEYDNDILQDGTCVSIPLTDLAKFIDEDRLLHYRVRITEVKTPRKMKVAVRHSCPPNGHQADFQQTRIEGVNLKNVPTDVIVTRKFGDNASPNLSTDRAASSSEDEIEKIRRLYYNRHNSDSESDPELDAFIAKRWGTPQLHFNRKFLRNVPSDISSSEDAISQQRNGDTLGDMSEQRRQLQDDRTSISSTATNYRKRMTNTLRRSMRTLRVDFKALTSKKSSNAEKQPETA